MGGTICPVGPNVWGPDVGDRMSGDHMRSGPNASQPSEIQKYFCWFVGANENFAFEIN